MLLCQCVLKASLLSRRPFVRFTNSELRRSALFFRHFHAAPPSGVPVNVSDWFPPVSLSGGIGGATPSGLEMAKRLARHVWPKGQWNVKGRVLFAFCLLIAAKLINATVPFVLRDTIDYFNGKLPAELSLGFALPSEAILSTGILLIIAYGAARVSTSMFNELRNAVFARVAQRSIRDISRNIFLHLHSLDLSFHLNRQTGALSKAIDRGTRGMSTTLNSLVFNILPTALEMALVGTIFYTKCGPQFTWAMIGCLGMYATATIGITRWRTKFRLQMNEADNEAGNRAIDSLINYETVKYFNNEQLEADRYDHFMRRFEHASLKTATSLALLNFAQNAIFSAGLVGVMCLAAFNVQNGVMSVGDIVLVNTLLFQMSIPLNFLGSVYRDIRQGFLDMQTMFSLIKLESRVVECLNARPLNVSASHSHISFRDVSFDYIPGKSILRSLSFDVPSGKKVALVGGSGSGKSTIVRLLYRLCDAQSGQININGQDITSVRLDSLRRAIAIVPQDSVLFHDDILYNIHYGNREAPLEKVYEVAKTADLHNAILGMPAGYETIVGERGLKLSGGEKQRVAIARAILKDAPIIVYDEATSSLDALTEENIMRSLKQAFSGRTSLFIAHRLATIVDADIIYVLDRGTVVESGTHSQLVRLPDGKYANLWHSQHRVGAELELARREAERQKKREEEEVMLDMELSEGKCCGGMTCNR